MIETGYEKQDYVVHWSGKVCRIDQISKLKMMDKEEVYYIMHPVREAKETIYVPVRKADESLRPVMSKEEAVKVIKELPDIEPLRIHDEKMREREYKNAFHSNDCRARVRIVKELYQRKQERVSAGKKMASSDAETMSMAERSFEEELAASLGIRMEEVKGVISKILKNVREE
ncbi:hypothetical protein GPL15_00685 [Clostridium sp. MCC353]|uniref:CarD family transcriptional regulator n=1 Tax=Clostridium sp. MCC353 TaxID=2592646 RepID=UPI001C00D484|nr:CarD family transcriptional regulator [Clostridium sp. MCC353]MBT9775024.1 hypothetical protein [Clostridium sp. MCC353]